MTLKEYLTTYNLMNSGDISAFSFLSATTVATMKSHMLHRYGYREIDFDDDVTVATVESVFTALVKTFMQVNNYRYSKLYNTITAQYNLNQVHKSTHSGEDKTTLTAGQTHTITESGDDETTVTAGTTMTTTPNNLKSQHKDRTYDNDTLEVTYEDIQSGSTKTVGSGSDTNKIEYGHISSDVGSGSDVNKTEYGHIITDEGEPIEQLIKERQLAEFQFIDLMCMELTNYVCLMNWVM